MRSWMDRSTTSVSRAGDAPRRHAEVEVPDRLLQITRHRSPLDARLVVRVGELAAEALGADPPAVAVGPDPRASASRFASVTLPERGEVVVLAGLPVVPHAEQRGEHGGDARLVDRREPPRLRVAGEERLDVAGEAVDPLGSQKPP